LGFMLDSVAQKLYQYWMHAKPTGM